MYLFIRKMHKNLRILKKSSTFAAAFGNINFKLYDYVRN